MHNGRMEQQSELAKAEAELASIPAKIAALQQRQRNLEVFVKMGRDLYPANPFRNSPPAAAPTPAPTHRTMAQVFSDYVADRNEAMREGTMKARILELSRGLILTHGPLSTAQLVRLIEDAGQPITGKDKNVTVSVILSRSDEFVSDRSRGWSLAPAEKTPEDVAASPGPSAT